MGADPAAPRVAAKERRDAAIAAMGITPEQYSGISGFDKTMVEKLIGYALERENEALESKRVLSIKERGIEAFQNALIQQAHESLVLVNDTLRNMFSNMSYTEHMRGRIAAKREHEEQDAGQQLGIDMVRVKGDAKPLPTRR